MPRYKLTIAYDGTDFCGWQRQLPPAGMEVRADKVMAAGAGAASPEASANPDPRERIVLRTVQEVVQRAVQDAVRQPAELLGASRTDAGVHARGQVAAFTSETWPEERGVEPLRRAINSGLPPDVLVRTIESVASSFDPIGDCTAKSYSYTLHVSPDRPVFDRRFVHHVWTPLDAKAMNAAASRIVGEHDFAAFAKAGHGRESTVRTVFQCRVLEVSGGETESQRETTDPVAPCANPTPTVDVHPSSLGTPDPSRFAGGPGCEARAPGDAGPEALRRSGASHEPVVLSHPARRFRIEVSGSGFLYNMVRIIAGTLVEVGRGRLTPEDVSAAIESRDRRRGGPTLPPTGLCLEWVKYR